MDDARAGAGGSAPAAAAARRRRLLVSRLALAGALLLVAVGIVLNREHARDGADQARGFAHSIGTRWHGEIVTDGLQARIAPLVARPDRPVAMTDLPDSDRTAAFGALDRATSVYPPGFLDTILHRVVLAGGIEMWGTEVGGFFDGGTIALNEQGAGSAAGAGFVADSFHHELSSIVRNQVLFNVSDWTADNPPGFAYASLADYKAILAERPSVEGDDVLHEQGFVSRYGTTSLDNDWNTYAERVFGHGRDLAVQIARFPRMRDKVRQLLDIYAKLDPRFEPYFRQTGLRAATAS